MLGVLASQESERMLLFLLYRELGFSDKKKCP